MNGAKLPPLGARISAETAGDGIAKNSVGTAATHGRRPTSRWRIRSSSSAAATLSTRSGNLSVATEMPATRNTGAAR